MIKKPFFSLGLPNLKYLVDHEQEVVKEIAMPGKITLLLKFPETGDVIPKVGDEVKTGQKLKLTENSEDYVLSTVTGTITEISKYVGYLGQTYTSISMDAAKEDQWADETQKAVKDLGPANINEFLASLPGKPDFASLFKTDPPINTIVINGIDQDLGVMTNQFVVKTGIERLIEGIGHLKKVTRADRVIIIVPPGLESPANKTGAEVKVIKPIYPNTLAKMVMSHVLGKVVPAGMSCEELGVGFINAEALVALANVFSNGEIPVHKILTVIGKANAPLIVKARIGTPVKDILDTFEMQTDHEDRLIMGGPMLGTAIYSEDMPILPDTDAIMVQDKTQVTLNSDSQCVNCGECVKVCPAKVPVNMLIRVLGSGLFEEAAGEYDLHSCIECGLCNYVCIARIPVFHHIMLGKHEFARITTLEESNA